MGLGLGMLGARGDVALVLAVVVVLEGVGEDEAHIRRKG